MQHKQQGKLIILSAPSGAGKTTIVKQLIDSFGQLEFSISATSRPARGVEKDGVDYYFLSNEEFGDAVKNDKFVEWEEVYAGTCYGTLRSEIERIWSKGNVIIFDVDVKGGIKLKEIFAEQALSLFIMPPSIEELRNRLISRGTDSAETIEKRVGKAELEIAHAPRFDKIIVNDDLQVAIIQAKQVIAKFLE